MAPRRFVTGVLAAALLACGCGSAGGGTAATDAPHAGGDRAQPQPLPYRAATPNDGTLDIIERRRLRCLEGNLTATGGAMIGGFACLEPIAADDMLLASWVMDCQLERFVVFGWVRPPVRSFQARLADGTVKAATPLRTRLGHPRTAFVLALQTADLVQAWEGLDDEDRVIRAITGEPTGPPCGELPFANGNMDDFPKP